HDITLFGMLEKISDVSEYPASALSPDFTLCRAKLKTGIKVDFFIYRKRIQGCSVMEIEGMKLNTIPVNVILDAKKKYIENSSALQGTIEKHRKDLYMAYGMIKF